jgi:hypothetical protein
MIVVGKPEMVLRVLLRNERINSYAETTDGRVRPALLRDILRYEDHSRRRVAWDQEGDVFVSTVFLVLDHDYSQIFSHTPLVPHRPLVYETMACRDGDYLEESQRRYRSRIEALAGHREVCLEYLGREPRGQK